MITHEIRERKGGGITHTPDENMVGSQISAVCAVSFELFFSATQELINFSLFNPPSPPPVPIPSSRYDSATASPTPSVLSIFLQITYTDGKERLETKRGVRPVDTDKTKKYFGLDRELKKSLRICFTRKLSIDRRQ